jgi:hypothetical protein
MPKQAAPLDCSAEVRAELTAMSRSRKGGSVEAFVDRTNEHPKPFHWRKREVKGSQLRNTIINLCN